MSVASFDTICLLTGPGTEDPELMQVCSWGRTTQPPQVSEMDKVGFSWFTSLLTSVSHAFSKLGAIVLPQFS